MADIAAGDVTYTIMDRSWGSFGYRNTVKLTFGDGALYYKTATKVPVTKAKLGLPNAIKSFRILENTIATGYVWDFDTSTELLKGFYGDYDAVADGGLIELADTVQPTAQEVWVVAEGY
jgi:hypothetical protein